ncbi:MAG TPA: hypothetical protein VKM36_11440 [Balneolaceae bacterium]|nr:hypothetical protein [Balneolaceae bacterium]
MEHKNNDRRLTRLVLKLIRAGYWTLFVLTVIMFGSPFITSLIFSGSGAEMLPSLRDPEYILMSIQGFLHCASYLLVAAVLFIVHEMGVKYLLNESNAATMKMSSSG